VSVIEAHEGTKRLCPIGNRTLSHTFVSFLSVGGDARLGAGMSLQLPR
jgi:hypothetical protein